MKAKHLNLIDLAIETEEQTRKGMFFERNGNDMIAWFRGEACWLYAKQFEQKVDELKVLHYDIKIDKHSSQLFMLIPDVYIEEAD